MVFRLDDKDFKSLALKVCKLVPLIQSTLWYSRRALDKLKCGYVGRALYVIKTILTYLLKFQELRENFRMRATCSIVNIVFRDSNK